MLNLRGKHVLIAINGNRKRGRFRGRTTTNGNRGRTTTNGNRGRTTTNGNRGRTTTNGNIENRDSKSEFLEWNLILALIIPLIDLNCHVTLLSGSLYSEKSLVDDKQQSHVSNQTTNLLPSTTADHSKQLLIKISEMGHFGWIQRDPLPSDASNYHWTILLSNNPQTQDAWINCPKSRNWISVLDHPELCDISLDFLLKKPLSDVIRDARHLLDNQSIVLKNIQESDQKGESSQKTHEVDDVCSETSFASSTTLNSSTENCRKGVLYLVGMGPGSPDLMTLKAHNLIHSCPVIISDRLVCTDIYKSIPSSTKLLFSRKVCGKAQLAQKEINDWILQYLEAGLDVVRAKGGDPFVFGRGGEEWKLAQKHGYKVEWVPGISSCIAAAGAAGIPVTHRGVAESFVVCTGQLKDGSKGTIPAFSSKRTLVLLMAVGVLDSLVTLLPQLGYPLHIPVAVVHRATWPDQKVVMGTLDTISQSVARQGIKSHAAIIIGNVVGALSSE